ncbi:unnamed protein product [Linum tenue]|uniref:Uncharacterized protein n=1 Tax=Linum tenue TaxID=586396 RepID=A0AAV0J5J2_9ROSI|nr:unnamed protein product [Linum tenue]
MRRLKLQPLLSSDGNDEVKWRQRQKRVEDQRWTPTKVPTAAIKEGNEVVVGAKLTAMDAAAVLGITGVRVFNQGEEEQESSGARRFTGDKDSSDLEPRLWF